MARPRILLVENNKATQDSLKNQLTQSGFDVDVAEPSESDFFECLETRAKRLEGALEERCRYVSKANSMATVNEQLAELRRETMRGTSEESTILILGEKGTEREGIARMAHTASRRGKGPWISVNCSDSFEPSLEAELFGYEAGAFSGVNQSRRGLIEVAKGGTLFLDEISKTDAPLQAKLLRMLKDKTFHRIGGKTALKSDIRLIFGSLESRNSQENGRTLNEELHQALSHFKIQLPALRDRKDDILSMAIHFARKSFKKQGKTFPGFSTETEENLINYPWPGNVHELLSYIERIALLHEGNEPVNLSPSTYPSTRHQSSTGARKLELVQSPFHLHSGSGDESNGYMTLKKQWHDSFEREYLLSALSKHQGNVSAAAREAKLDRSNFLRLLRRHGLNAQTFRKAA